MTYQRNIVLLYCLALLLLVQDPLDDVLPDDVVRVEVDADHDARDQHDHRSLNHLRLAGPLDLLQLRPRLAEEREAAATRLRGWRGRPTLAAVALAVTGRLRGTPRRCACLLRARSAALCPRLSRH